MADRTNPEDITHRQCQLREPPAYQETVEFFTRHRPPRPIPARDLCFKFETCRPALCRDSRDVRTVFPFVFRRVPDQPKAGPARAACFTFEIAILVHPGIPVAPDSRSRSQTHARQGRARILSAKALKTRNKRHSEMFRL
ncbi:hypothetical protein [Burkholderia sp. FL-7-2-10-S1-D7]|uniref:hypothetical protein n=1 Tax=Burkholderia sp. FL-7-2-10-S1-D7 TaxID=1637866 RepID=UPI0012E3D1BF|nr:hypothetical protein [Burkholderia sp. FL-7-2-10-S1-D7]